MWYALRIVNPRWFGNRIDALIKKYRKKMDNMKGLSVAVRMVEKKYSQEELLKN